MKNFEQGFFKQLSVILAAVVFAIGAAGSSRAQDTPQPIAGEPASAGESVQPTPIPVSEVIPESEATLSALKESASQVTTLAGAGMVERDLPVLTREIETRLAQTARDVEGTQSLEDLKPVEAGWQPIQARLSKLASDLAATAKGLETELKKIQKLNDVWTKTLDNLESAGSPKEVLQRSQETLQSIVQTRIRIEAEQARIVLLQEKVSGQQARIDGVNATIKQKRESLVGTLFVQDSPPIWAGQFWTLAQQDLGQTAAASFRERNSKLVAFADRNKGRIVLHAIIFLLLVTVLMALRRRARPRVKNEPELQNVIFSNPVSTALILAVLAHFWLYPEIPQIITPVFGAIALIPTVLILRRLSNPKIYPILNALIIFFLIDQVRTVLEPFPIISRLLFLAELAGAGCFLFWVYRARLISPESNEVADERMFRVIKRAANVALPILALAIAANAAGFVSLSQLLGNAILKSAYVAVILYASVRIIDGLVRFGLRQYPLNKLGMVRSGSGLIQNRVQLGLKWIGFIFWLLTTLSFLELRRPLLGSLWSALTSDLVIGSFEISPSDVLAFVITVWGAFLVSRFVRFVLDEDVYPRTSISRGVPYAISTIVHYMLLLIGFFIALGIIGFDLTKFTILVGAFGVGIGFGLQNIVNNFVSGLILLFERPVSVDDMVQIGEDEGKLKAIGLRASVMRTLQGSEVIVPNGDLISGTVVNWTLSDQQRRLEMNVGVEYGTDPEKVIEILLKVASEHAEVMKDPAPRGLFMAFGESSLDFQLRAWTLNFDNWVVVKSELNLAIHDALKRANIVIPFPQRDLHLVSVNDEIQTGLGMRTKDRKSGGKG